MEGQRETEIRHKEAEEAGTETAPLIIKFVQVTTDEHVASHWVRMGLVMTHCTLYLKMSFDQRV